MDLHHRQGWLTGSAVDLTAGEVQMEDELRLVGRYLALVWRKSPRLIEGHMKRFAIIYVLALLAVAPAAAAAEHKPLNVTLDAQWTVIQGQIFVRGKTNLPEGTYLTVRVAEPARPFNDLQNVTVKRGEFVTEEGMFAGRSLRPGTYLLDVSLPLIQPPEVERRIGHNGENLAGKFTRDAGGRRTVEYKAEIEIR